VQAPVHIASSEIVTPIQTLHMGKEIGPTVAGGYELHVRFTNDGNQPIKRIVFALNDGRTVVDAGNFAPGVTIDHTFDLPPCDADSCRVDSATFADGTQWKANGHAPYIPSGTFQTAGPSAEGGG